jgi:hypothetical protein
MSRKVGILIDLNPDTIDSEVIIDHQYLHIDIQPRPTGDLRLLFRRKNAKPGLAQLEHNVSLELLLRESSPFHIRP